MAVESEMSPKRHRLRIVVRVAAGVVLLGIAVFALKDRLPSPSAIGAALGAADLRWVAVAAVAEVVSLGLFARQQRRLLRAFGVPMTLRRALAVTYGRSALSISMPAGAAVSAGFAYAQYRHTGASRSAATTVLVLSGLVTMCGLAVLYVGGTLGGPLLRLAEDHPVGAVLVGLAAVLLVVGAAAAVHLHPHKPWDPSRWRVPAGLAVALERVLEVVRLARTVPARHWVPALLFSCGNWAADLVCLGAAARAVDLPIGLGTLAAVYVGVQIVRQIPVTPGGIGLIEAALLTALVAAGADPGAAGAAVLIYRLLSCWLVIPVGALAAFALRRAPDLQAEAEDADAADAAEEAEPGGAPVRSDRR